jgi:hypothetical protein
MEIKFMTTEITSQNNNQTNPSPRYKKKAPSRGGARQGAGRRKGSSSKTNPTKLIHEMHKIMKKSYSELLIEELNKSISAGDTRLTNDYLKYIGNKILADKVDVDHTTLGESLRPVYNFNKNELTEWSPVYTLTNEQKD